MSTKTNKCRSKNPATCRYHGSLAVHKEVLAKKTDTYLELLRGRLANDPNVSEEQLQEASEAMNEAQATVDAHDENYESLAATEKWLTSVVSERDYRFDDPYDNAGRELKEVRERLSLAVKVRQKAGVSETDKELGWGSLYVTHVPNGSIIASGEKIVAVRVVPGMAKKREVVLENSNGERSARLWGAYTRVNVLTPTAQAKDPTSVVEAVVDPHQPDPWSAAEDN